MANRIHRALAFVTLAAACSRSAAPPETAAPASPSAGPGERASVLEPGAIRAPSSPQVPRVPRVPRAPAAGGGETPGGAVPATPRVPPAPHPVRVSVARVAATEGEDGRGNTVPATDPVAIDLETPDGWPGGALATTLRVGEAHFHVMGYPAVTTMRFIAADARALPANAEVALQYGPDGGRRRVLAAALPVLP